MYAASSPETEGIGGQYYLNCKAEKLPTIIHNKELLQRLWETSEELVGGITQN